MKFVEQHIMEIHEERPFEESWTKRFLNEFIKVDHTRICNKSQERLTVVWTKEQWQEIKEKGVYQTWRGRG